MRQQPAALSGRQIRPSHAAAVPQRLATIAGNAAYAVDAPRLGVAARSCWRCPSLLAAPPCAGRATPACEPPAIAGVPIDFILFALTLIGVALFHHHTLQIAVDRPGRDHRCSRSRSRRSPKGQASPAWLDHLGHEWVLLANLLGLLLGFALLSKHFEASRVPPWLPKLLPDDWKGGFVLLVMIFVLS